MRIGVELFFILRGEVDKFVFEGLLFPSWLGWKIDLLGVYLIWDYFDLFIFRDEIGGLW